MFLRLASKSLWHRKGAVLLTILAMTVSIYVLLAVEHIRHQTKANFNSSVSGTDLIVGARTSQLNLLLYSVFRIGSPTNNINWQSYQRISAHPRVAWSIPISLGDSHQGYRVMGTTADYFQHFSYGKKRPLNFAEGQAFEKVLDVVLGAAVAKKLGYQLGDKIVLAHGLGNTSFSLHDDKPFTVVGILKATGTPVDQTLHISLQGMEAIHSNWQQQHGNSAALQPKAITAFMLGLSSRLATFTVQRDINNYRQEPLTAILPGVALAELWQMMASLENTLRLISLLILLAALLGLSSMMLASTQQRKQEIYLLRIIGAPPLFLFLLIELEALLICLLSIIFASALLLLSLLIAGENLSASFGMHITPHFISGNTLLSLALVIAATLLTAAIPSAWAYWRSSRSV